jgi:superfamily II DNA/RNA helicase
MKFNSFKLDPRLQENVRRMGFEEPTPIQSATIPQALEGRDILGSAETGTGKTAAFLLPMLQKFITSPRTHDPRGLVVVPTRELALQVADHARQLGRGLKILVATIYVVVCLRHQE